MTIGIYTYPPQTNKQTNKQTNNGTYMEYHPLNRLGGIPAPDVLP